MAAEMEIDYETALRIADESVGRHGHDARAAPAAIRVLYLVAQLDFEVTLGGVVGWLTSAAGRHGRATVAALQEIGATRCAELVERMLAHFPGGVPSEDDRERSRQIRALWPVAMSAWRELGDCLLEWPDDVDAMLRAHVGAHQADFALAAGGEADGLPA
jgi:hypothetical protein